MTARAVETRPSPASIRVPGVASTAIRDVLSGPETTATVLGTASQAVWLLVEEDVVVVSTRDATRLPNGIETATEEAVAGFRMVRHNASATVGSGRVAFDGLIVDVARWWNPRPTLRRISAAELESAASDLPSTVPDIASGPLSAALSAGVPTGVLHAAEALIGRGPGLTPEGDDLLAGALAATRLLGEALADPESAALLDSVAGPLEQFASTRTPTFSAALIRHAIEGRVAAPAGALLRALTGRGDAAARYRELGQVGHTSGPALAAGMMLGTHSLLQSQLTPNGGKR